MNDDGEVWVDPDLGLMLKPLDPERRAARTDREKQLGTADATCLGSEGSVRATSQSRGVKK
jgi:hypothetical protein